jgi:SOS-response transcriptional repressor LexA
MKQKDVAEAFGISSQAVSQWEAGRTRPDSQRLTNLARLFDIRLEWLLDGRGTTTFEESPSSSKMLHTTHVPVIDRAQAGDWMEGKESFVLGTAGEFLHTGLQVSSSTFALVIEDRSMELEFQPGDKVIIDPEVKPQPGDFVVAKRDDDEEATFKKYRVRNQDEDGRDVIELIPLNSDWPTLMIDQDNPGHIVGTMVEQRRYRRG